MKNENEKEFKSTMFADDATFAMDGSLKSFQTLLNILDEFTQISVFKLNVNKTIVLRIGSLNVTNIHHCKQMKFLMSSESAKTLGIVFSNDTTKMINLKAGWMKRIFDEQNNGLWKEYCTEKLNAFGGKLVLQSNLDIKD